MTETTPQGSVSLHDYIAVLRRRSTIVVAAAAIGLGLGAAYFVTTPKQYTSVAEVQVRPVVENPFAGSSTSLDKQLSMPTEMQLATSGNVAQAAKDALQSPSNPTDLEASLTVSNPADTQVLGFSFSAKTPAAAQAGAQAFANAYLSVRQDNVTKSIATMSGEIDKQVESVSGQLADVNRQLSSTQQYSGQRDVLLAQQRSLGTQMSSLQDRKASLATLDTTPGQVSQDAGLPAAPSSPKLVLSVGGGFAVGLIIGVILAFIREATDNRLRGPRDAATRLGVPVIAEGGARRHRRFGLTRPSSPPSPVENIRKARNRLLLQGVGSDIGSLLVVSPNQRAVAGLSVRLSASFAETGRHVLLVSDSVHMADTRHLPARHGPTGLAPNGVTPEASGTAPANPQATDVAAQASAQSIALDIPFPEEPGGADAATAPNSQNGQHGPHGQGFHVNGASRPGAGLAVNQAADPAVPTAPTGARRAGGVTVIPRDAVDLWSQEAISILLATYGPADLVVLDCPPLLDRADALALAGLAEAVLLAVDPDVTTRRELDETRDLLAGIGSCVAGIVYGPISEPDRLKVLKATETLPVPFDEGTDPQQREASVPQHPVNLPGARNGSTVSGVSPRGKVRRR